MKLTRLRPGDLLLLLHISRLLVRWMRLRRRLTVTELVRSFDTQAGANRRRFDPERTVQLTRGLLRRVYTNRFCMQQSLILLNLLTRANCQAVFHLGVATRNGELVGHAWLDLDGRPFGERRDPRTRFSVVFSHPHSNS